MELRTGYTCPVSLIGRAAGFVSWRSRVRLLVANFVTHLCFMWGSCRLLARRWRVLVRHPGNALGSRPPWYNWKIVQSGVKPHSINQSVNQSINQSNWVFLNETIFEVSIPRADGKSLNFARFNNWSLISDVPDDGVRILHSISEKSGMPESGFELKPTHDSWLR